MALFELLPMFNIAHNTRGHYWLVPTRLLARWESRSPMNGHFSDKINMNNCIQRVFFRKFGNL